MAMKIGIIGAGGMASYHIPGFRSAGAEVVAIADMNA
jgi:predicted dehydrogenase